jgi:hypothetical protein
MAFTIIHQFFINSDREGVVKSFEMLQGCAAFS